MDELNEQQIQMKIKDLLDRTDLVELTAFVKERILHRNFIQIWNNLLQTFTDTTASHRKRYDITIIVLKLIDETENSNSHILSEIVTRLRLELPKFRSEHLIQICSFCIERIQRGELKHNCWIDLLPEILSILVDIECVTYNDTEMSGPEFKKHIINSLFIINWSPSILIPLCVMFREISLTKEEHLQIVNKLGSNMEKLECEEIPAFTYQLLKFCSTQNSWCIFMRLQYYFTSRIYKNCGKDLQSASSELSNFDDISDASNQNAVTAESTVLYHIHNAATLGHGSIKKYINSVKFLLKAPEYILHPFQLTVLLTISTVSIFEEQILDIIRGCIARCISEEYKKQECAWFKDIVVNSTKIEDIVAVVIENSSSERQIVVAGLVSLSFILLGVGAGLGVKNVAEAQWDLGTFIILKLLKKKREVANTVIQQLCYRIISEQNIIHLTECLYQICRNFTLTVIENQNAIIQLIEQILQLPGSTSRMIIDAIIPMLKVSTKIRDNLILILRKALHSRKVETRQMAVSGFLKLLKNLRITNLAALSQSGSTNSNYSLMTQMSLETHTNKTVNKFSNEALCLEILSILRCCFMQQAEVRAELYEGLYDAVCLNIELGIPVLDLFWTHFLQFYNLDETVLPPLTFTKVMVTKGVDVILQEPLGLLIYTIGLIVTKVKETYDVTNPSITRFTTILDSLCERMPRCELVHFDLDSGRDLLDNLPECQIDVFVLKQAISVHEALLGYLICSWDSNSENYAQKISSLFQGYSRLIDFSKNLGKVKKAEGRKKSKDDTRNKTTSPQKPKIFKPTMSVLDFQTTEKLLNLLHEPTIPWADTAQTTILKVKKELHQYVLNVIIQLIQNVKQSKCIERIHTKPYLNYFTDISTVLYQRVIKTLLLNIIDFDRITACLAVECFHNIFTLITTNFKTKLGGYLSSVDLLGKDEDLGTLLMPYIEVYQEYINKHEEYFEEDPDTKKILVLLVSTYTTLVLNLPNESPQIKNVLDWLKTYTEDNTVSDKSVGNSLISLMFTMHIKHKYATGLFDNVALKLCDIIGTVSQDKTECQIEIKILNEGTALPTLSHLTNIIKTMLNQSDWLIQRLRAEHSMIIFPGGDKIERRKELLKDKERNLCCYLCQIINVCSLLSDMTVPPGTYAEIIFKMLIHLYNTLNSFTKYFILISSKVNPAFQSARFERVLKLSGKKLSNLVYEFILYIEEGHHHDDGTQQSKKKSTADPNKMKLKVLRETRLIPKLVYEMEQFGRNVIVLSKKTKIDLSKYVGLGTSRDFRIKLPALKEALEKINITQNETNVTTNDDDDDPNEDETASLLNGTPVDDATDVEIETSMEVDEESVVISDPEQDQAPPKKKARKSLK